MVRPTLEPLLGDRTTHHGYRDGEQHLGLEGAHDATESGTVEGKSFSVSVANPKMSAGWFSHQLRSTTIVCSSLVSLWVKVTSRSPEVLTTMPPRRKRASWLSQGMPWSINFCLRSPVCVFCNAAWL